MNKTKIYFTISSVAFLLVLAISPMKDFFQEWKGYQHQYNNLIKDLTQRINPTEIGIKQIWNQKLDRIDRCVTCHNGLKEKALRDAREPFRTHPKMYHDFEDYGCTICHEGQGLATTYKESIGQVKYWDRPILPQEYMEASCGKCHKETPVPQAPILSSGRQLIKENNCVGCHALDGYPKQWVPNLNGIGSKVNRTWLVNWLKDPKVYFPKTKMPKFMFTDDEANILADFLMTFKSFPNNASLDTLPKILQATDNPDRTKLVEQGTKLFSEARCISCHSVNGRGGYVATELGKIASKVSSPWLYSYLKNPKRLQPGVGMPRFRFNENELEAVTAYMQSEFVDSDIPETSSSHDPAYYEKGLALFKKYNCSGCHQLGSMKRSEEMAPMLTSIGSKKNYEIDFGKSGIKESLPSYLFAKLKNPRVFSATMKMPDYKFSDEEAQAIVVALLGNTNDPIPDEYKIQPKPESVFAPQGEFGKLIDDLSCLSCHTMFGKGRLVATDLTLEASQAKRAWIEQYFKIPYSLRPILKERMPNLFLSDKEIKILADYMTTVFIADSLDREITVTDSKTAKGKILYFEKYACQSCHQINSTGGYVGPALDKIGSRLKSGWIFHWLKNPQSFRPESIEPNNNLSDEEAEALTAFLLTLD